MAKQTRLEAKGFEKREELLAENDYQQKSNEYSASHKDAVSDGDALGKGYNTTLGISDLPGENPNTGISYKVVDTTKGGGLYDIKGRNGVGGREKSQLMNLYGPNYEYGVELIDESANEAAGQITPFK